MDANLKQAIEKAEAFLKQRDELYNEWDRVYGMSVPENETGTGRLAQLNSMDAQIENLEYNAVYELRDLLTAILKATAYDVS